MDVQNRSQLIVADNDTINATLDAVFKVHSELGPGLLESAYEAALTLELLERGLIVKRQTNIPLVYKDKALGIGYRADIIVNDNLLLELKCVDQITNLHIAQVITYLKLLNFKRGFLLNFNVKLMKHGTKRISI